MSDTAAIHWDCGSIVRDKINSEARRLGMTQEAFMDLVARQYFEDPLVGTDVNPTEVVDEIVLEIEATKILLSKMNSVGQLLHESRTRLKLEGDKERSRLQEQLMKLRRWKNAVLLKEST